MHLEWNVSYPGPFTVLVSEQHPDIPFQHVLCKSIGAFPIREISLHV